MDKPEYALSIKQPWAWLICDGFKDIENRDWRIGRKPGYHDTNFRIELPCRIFVHAGKKLDFEGLNYILERELPGHERIPMVETLDYGAIIGEVTITDCVTESKSPWFVGKYGFVLSDPVLYDKPVPCRGQLGFFKPDCLLLQSHTKTII